MKKKTKKKTSKKARGEDQIDVLAEAELLNGDESVTKKGRPSSVDYAEFVKLWTVSDSVGDVATELGIKTTSASAIANRLRKGGVKLKRFPRRGSQPIDVKDLNRIVASED
jgi:hypothetical protein